MSVSVTAVATPEWLWQKTHLCVNDRLSWSQQCSSYYTIICFSRELAAPVLFKSLWQNTRAVTACIHPPCLVLTTCVRLCCRLHQPVFGRNPDAVWQACAGMSLKMFSCCCCFPAHFQLAQLWEPFLLKCHFSWSEDRQQEDGGLDYPLAWLLNGVISLHSCSEDAVEGQKSALTSHYPTWCRLSLLTALTISLWKIKWLYFECWPLKAQSHLSRQSMLAGGL